MTSTRAAEGNLFVVAVIAALIAGIGASVFAIASRDSLWGDEIWSMTHVIEALPYFFVNIVRQDIHPPLYFLQLKFWTALFPTDHGAMLNSLLWHLLSAVAIFLVGRAWLGRSVGMLGAALFVLAPQAVWASYTVRMYCMIPALAVAAWWINVQLLTARPIPRWLWGAAFFTELAFALTHAIAFFFVALVALAAAAQAYWPRRQDVPWKAWTALQVLVVVLLVPFALSALIRQSSGIDPSDAITLAAMAGSMVAGWGMHSVGIVPGAVLYGLAVVLGLRFPATRAMTAALLIFPLLVASVAGAVMKPMFKTPVFASVLLPFMCLVLSATLCSREPGWLSRLRVPILVAMIVLVFPAIKVLQWEPPYKQLGALLKERVRPGDVVVVPKLSTFWGVARYAVGPDWGSPLETRPLESNEAWGPILRKISPGVREALRLDPKSNSIVHNGVRYVIAENAVAETSNADRAWVVKHASYAATGTVADHLRDSGLVATVGTREVLTLHLYERRR